MVEFNLPQNSKIKRGQDVASAPAGATNIKRFRIYRYDPESGENPRLDTFPWIWTPAGRWSWTH
jgi:succinate dehydrogenase / fumarate reductase, iron-sulfur subunit